MSDDPLDYVPELAGHLGISRSMVRKRIALGQLDDWEDVLDGPKGRIDDFDPPSQTDEEYDRRDGHA